MSPSEFVHMGDIVYFGAHDALTGQELWAMPVTALQAECIGDCNGDAVVTIDELITGVRITLGESLTEACSAFDADRSGTVTVDELIRAIDGPLNSCR